MPPALKLTQDDKYGLEPAGAPAAGGVTDDKYGLEPAGEQPPAPAKPPEKQKPTTWEAANKPLGTDVTTRTRESISNLAGKYLPPSVAGPVAAAAHAITAIPTSIVEAGRRMTTPLGVATLGAGSGTKAGSEFLGAWPRVKRLVGAGETALGSLFAGAGAKEALTPRQEGETGLQEFERRAGGAGQAMLGGAPIVHGAAEAAPSAGDVGLAARTETGKLKPGIRAASRLAGAFAGHMTGIPYMGELGGYLLGPSIADMVIPNRPFDIPTRGVEPGAPLPLAEEAYQHRAEDLARRGKEQAAIDRPIQRAAAKEEAAAREPVPISEGPTAVQHEATRAAQRNVAARNARQFVPVSESPVPKKAGAEGEAGEEGTPRIVVPSAAGEESTVQPTIESEGRPATWDDQTVMNLASRGNRAAIAQVGVRGLAEKFADDPRIKNIRYVMGDIDYRNLITSPREVTRFTPEGQPIRQEVPEPIGPPTDRIARASRERPAPTPEPGPATLPLNFEQAAPIPSWKPLLPHPEEAPASFRAGVEPPEGVLPGMAEHVAAQNEGAARVRGEELTRQLNTPTNISERAGAMETLSPLFRGKGPQGELLQPLGSTETVAPMTKPVTEVPFQIPEETEEGREPGADEGEEPEEVHIKGLTAPIKTKVGMAKESAVPNIEKLYSREEIEDARGLIASEVDAMLSADKPGRYFDENPRTEEDYLTPQGQQGGGTFAGGSWRGVKSGRNMFPFMRDNPKWGAAQLKKALRNEDSALYKRAIDRAVQMIREEKENPSVGPAVNRKRFGIEEEPPTE